MGKSSTTAQPTPRKKKPPNLPPVDPDPGFIRLKNTPLKGGSGILLGDPSFELILKHTANNVVPRPGVPVVSGAYYSQQPKRPNVAVVQQDTEFSAAGTINIPKSSYATEQPRAAAVTGPLLRTLHHENYSIHITGGRFGFQNVNGHHRCGQYTDGYYRVAHPGCVAIGLRASGSSALLLQTQPQKVWTYTQFAHHRDFWKSSGCYRSAYLYMHFMAPDSVMLGHDGTLEASLDPVTFQLRYMYQFSGELRIDKGAPPLLLRGGSLARAYYEQYYEKVPLVPAEDLQRLAGDPGSFPVVEAVTNLDPHSMQIWCSNAHFSGINIRDQLDMTDHFAPKVSDDNDFRLHPFVGWASIPVDDKGLNYVALIATEIRHNQDHDVPGLMGGQKRIRTHPLYYRTVMNLERPIVHAGYLNAKAKKAGESPVWYKLPQARAFVFPGRTARRFGYAGSMAIHNETVT